jgi:hypothetical protein
LAAVDAGERESETPDAAEPVDDERLPTNAATPPKRRLSLDAVRVVTWASIVCAFAVACGRSIADGWIAVSDDGAIALRSWNVFSANTPLIGQHTQVAPALARSVYDLGPLQYWLLAVPVHLDPVHGVLWGSAFWCVVAALLAVEAARSAVGKVGSVVVALAVVWATWWIPGVALNPVWNPYLGAMFFFALLASSFAVLLGHHRWWPVAVVAGSVATQAHLVYAIDSLFAVVFSGIVLFVRAVRSRRRWMPLAIGLLAAIASWIAPLVQQLTSSPGNITLLLRSQNGQARLGLAYGLRVINAAVVPLPIWLRPEHDENLAHTFAGRSAAVGVVVLLLTAAVAILGWRQSNKPLMYMALLSTGSAIGCAVTIGNVVTTKKDTLAYMVAALLPLAVMVWATLAWGAVTAFEVLAARSAAGSPEPAVAATAVEAEQAPRPAGPRPRRPVVIYELVALAALLAASVMAQFEQAAGHDSLETPAAMRTSAQAVAKVETAVPRGPVNLYLWLRTEHPPPLYAYAVTMGMIWGLAQDGWHPLVPSDFTEETGPGYAIEPTKPRAVIFVTPSGVTVRTRRGA